ncbi:MAG: DEAD/DEAH box helicase [Firmicutes bacterium]|nr:DEAD/DEAH box helicase [Bacillota bacterium]
MEQKNGMINITGASESRVAPLAAELIRERGGQSLIVAATYTRAKRLATDLSFFHEQAGIEGPVLVLPEEDARMVAFEAKNNDDLMERMRVYKTVTSGRSCTVIAPVSAAIRKLPPRSAYTEHILRLRLGEDIDVSAAQEKLTAMGYERVPAIEARGEYSIRGGIIDIFPPDSGDPYRIELFDTEIDSIRTFDQESQRSRESLTSADIYPCARICRDDAAFAKAGQRIRRAYDRQIRRLEAKAAEDLKAESGSGKASGASAVKTEQTHHLRQRRDQLLEYVEQKINLQYLEQFPSYFFDETDYLWDYMDDPLILIDDPGRILENIDAAGKEMSEDIDVILSEGRGIGADFASVSGEADYFRLYEKEGYIFTPFLATIRNAPFLKELRTVNCRQMPSYNGRLDVLKTDLEGYLARGFRVTIVCSSSDRAKQMDEFLEHEGLYDRRIAKVGTNGVTQTAEHAPGSITVVEGRITSGMEFTDEKSCWMWEGDIFGGSRRSRRPRRAKTKGETIKSFADVQTGDYVVHESHGIGRFVGVEQLVVQGVKQDYLKVKYAGTDLLYIPVDQLGALQKYIGGEGAAPKLNKLTGGEWKQTKARAKAAVEDMAQDLIRVSAARMHEKGYAFSEDTPWQGEFEDSFPYEETDDQLKCIDEIKSDMEREVPMDRLLCGDVGFGKTEVAARALFKCVADGKQAAVLVPTTLLANQHYYTLKDRFEKFPFRVEMLSRFRTAKQQKKIIDDLAKGKLDLVIGTHRLLSKDVRFHDLGLLVVDEEQRFGVRHKERIKQLRTNVDVLTLSATPIPRTLHMSLSGLKDMSTLEEPPEDRYPVQT